MKSTPATVFFRPADPADGYLPEGPRAGVFGFWGLHICWVNTTTGPDAEYDHLHTVPWDHRGKPANHRRVALPARPGFVLPTHFRGVGLLGCDKVIGRFHTTDREWVPLASIPDTNPRTIINDAEVVPGGKGVVFGTKDTSFADPIAHLYLFTVDDNAVTVLAGGQTCSNGKVFADDGRTLFDIDTPRKVVTRYSFDLGKRALKEEGIAIDLRHRPDFPDGMCDAGDGTVIIAFYNPAFAESGMAVRYRLSTGEAVEEWTTPGSPRVTCPLLVRPERDEPAKLILTTAIEGMPADVLANCPNAGCLFVADADGCAVGPNEWVTL